MMNYQLLPYKRTAEMFENLFGLPISEGTLRNIQYKFSQTIQPQVDEIKQQISCSNVIHADETGLYTEGARHWLHVASTDLHTYYFYHKGRGKEAIQAAGIIPGYTNHLIHDFWHSYYQYSQCRHSLCNVHHMRDLQGLIDTHGYQWATRMKTFLLSSKEIVDRAKEQQLVELTNETVQRLAHIYKIILAEGVEEMPPLPAHNKGKIKKIKKGKAWNLLNRFKERPQEILGFIYDFQIPFDNNLAERDIRMIKVKQKISGSFRNKKMASAFCDIRSYISTVIKHRMNVFKAISRAIHPQSDRAVST